MRGHVIYAPYAGTMAARCFVVLRERGEQTIAEIADALKVLRKAVAWSLRPGIERGAVIRTVRQRDAKRVFVYSLKPDAETEGRDWSPPLHVVIPARTSRCPVDRPQGWASPIGIHPQDYAT